MMPQHHTPTFSQTYQPGLQNVSWVSPNPPLSMDAVNPPPAINSVPRPVRRQQVSRASEVSGGMDQSVCDANALPQLTIRDLQCLDPQTPGMSQAESHPLYHLPPQREDPLSEGRVQPSNHNQGLHTMWSNYGIPSPAQSAFTGPTGGSGGGSQELGSSFSMLEDGDEFLNNLVGGGGTTVPFQMKQEPQMGDAHTALVHSPRESQGNTYTNLLPRPMSNGTNVDPRRPEGRGPSVKHLQNPYSSGSAGSDRHFANLAEWYKAARHTDYKD